MNRREHSHLRIRRLRIEASVTSLSKRVPPKSRLERRLPFGIGVPQDSAAHVSLSSIFSFQRTDITDAMSWPLSLLASGPTECRLRGSLDFVQLSQNSETKLLVASSVAAVVGEAYIVGTRLRCQQGFRTFLNFLRQKFPALRMPLKLP